MPQPTNALIREIDARIAKLQELRKLAADPLTFDLLTDLLSVKNGQISPPTIGYESGKRKTNKKGMFISKIAEICRRFVQGNPFTIKQVIAIYEGDGNSFRAKNKEIAVYAALKRLAKRGIIEIAEKGVGAKPSLYRVPQRFPREITAVVREG